MFSRGRVKTLPFTSQASAEGVSVGRTITVGPAMSMMESADTHVVSSGWEDEDGWSEDGVVVVSALEEGVSSVSVVGRLRFLAFLSPLKERGLTILSDLWFVGAVGCRIEKL